MLGAVLGAGACDRQPKPTEQDVSAALGTVVEAKRPTAGVLADDERGHHLWQEVQRFYKQNGYQLVWSDGTRPRGQVEGLVKALRTAGEDGLEPADYQVEELDAARQAKLTRELAIDLDLSHGCVRLDRPEDLAKYVLRDQPEWTEAKIREAMSSGTERAVPLKQPLPIYLVYFTAWEENGGLQRVPDVYGLDRRQTAVETNNH